MVAIQGANTEQIGGKTMSDNLLKETIKCLHTYGDRTCKRLNTESL